MLLTRREAIGALGAFTSGALLPRLQGITDPVLAPGTPRSPERTALIAAFRAKADGAEKKFEARTHKSDWEMPYRLFRPEAAGKLPLLLFLHGSGGLGNDNVKQMGLGNIFGTRVFALPEHQKDFPCYVLAPQTDRGWVRYAPEQPGDSVATVIPGLGDGARLALEIIAALQREFAIDERRIYVTGQSMGGGGVWHLMAQRPDLFAAAVPCCGSTNRDDAAASLRTPLWNFHGDADDTVPVEVSRARIAARRKAGAHVVATEYAGVGHHAWEWAYTEPALLTWIFAQRRAA